MKAKGDLLILDMGQTMLTSDDGTTDLAPWKDLESTLVESAIEVSHTAEVRSYLESHPDMVAVTGALCRAARSAFGPDVFLALQVYRDPEVDDAHLLLRVRLRSYAPDTMQRIRSLSGPYEEELCEKSGAIVVTTDFCPIR